MLPTVEIPTIKITGFHFGGGDNTEPRHFSHWKDWLNALFPSYVKHEFGKRHVEFWEWVESIEPGKKPAPFVAIWPRGGAKSTSAELASVRVGYKKTRAYIWYVSSTQDKADKHVETIGAMLEDGNVESYYPALGRRKIGKYGNSKGWRRSRLRTDSGLTIDALGLDVGARGGKVENQRPDLIIFDDVDEKNDTPKTTQKKIDTITTGLLPAGSSDCAILFIQNVIHENSIAAQLSDGRADFMIDRIVSGPFPAIDGLVYEVNYDEKAKRNRYTITAGIATWDGQSIVTCEAQINEWGPTAFNQEAQHEVEARGGIWNHIEFRHCEKSEVPDIVRGGVWCDPAVTSNNESCANGIIADGIAQDGTVYRLFAWEAVDTPMSIIKRSIRTAINYHLDRVGVETNQGGDLWRDEYNSALLEVKEEYRKMITEALQEGTEELTEEELTKLVEIEMEKILWPNYAEAKAGAGTGSKIERNQRMLTAYERGEVVHVIGTHDVLERSLRRFPKEPLDLADAAYWGWKDLQAANATDLLAWV